MSGEVFIFKQRNKQGNNGRVFYRNGRWRLFYLSPAHEADGLFKEISCRLKTGKQKPDKIQASFFVRKHKNLNIEISFCRFYNKDFYGYRQLLFKRAY